MSDQRLGSLLLRCRPRSHFVHCLAVKPHQYAQAETHTPPAIFVSGLPLGATEAFVTELFGVFGAVVQAAMHRTKVRPGSAALAGICRP